jgi:homogentisate 1,2-dioxygenase
MKETNELAVMVDTFYPLLVAKEALPIEDPNYTQSWLEGDFDNALGE